MTNYERLVQLNQYVTELNEQLRGVAVSSREQASYTEDIFKEENRHNILGKYVVANACKVSFDAYQLETDEEFSTTSGMYEGFFPYAYHLEENDENSSMKYLHRITTKVVNKEKRGVARHKTEYYSLLDPENCELVPIAPVDAHSLSNMSASNDEISQNVDARLFRCKNRDPAVWIKIAAQEINKAINRGETFNPFSTNQESLSYINSLGLFDGINAYTPLYLPYVPTTLQQRKASREIITLIRDMNGRKAFDCFKPEYFDVFKGCAVKSGGRWAEVDNQLFVVGQQDNGFRMCTPYQYVIGFSSVDN